MRGEPDFMWNEPEPSLLKNDELQQRGLVLLGGAWVRPQTGVPAKWTIGRDLISLSVLGFRMEVPASHVERISHYRGLLFLGLQVHHRRAQGVPSLLVLGGDTDRLTAGLRALGYPVDAEERPSL